MNVPELITAQRVAHYRAQVEHAKQTATPDGVRRFLSECGIESPEIGMLMRDNEALVEYGLFAGVSNSVVAFALLQSHACTHATQEARFRKAERTMDEWEQYLELYDVD